MSKSDASFAAAVESRTRGIYVDLLRGNPSLTVGELQELCRGEFGKVLSTITLGELFAAKGAKRESAPTATSGNSSPKQGGKKSAKAAKPRLAAKKTTAKPGPKMPANAVGADSPKPTEVNTRTPDGRDAFDATVFAAIQSIAGPAGAGAIQKLTGGTNMQVRSACNRLIDASRLSWTGKARGTRYQVA